MSGRCAAGGSGKRSNGSTSPAAGARETSSMSGKIRDVDGPLGIVRVICPVYSCRGTPDRPFVDRACRRLGSRQEVRRVLRARGAKTWCWHQRMIHQRPALRIDAQVSARRPGVRLGSGALSFDAGDKTVAGHVVDVENISTSRGEPMLELETSFHTADVGLRRSLGELWRQHDGQACTRQVRAEVPPWRRS